MVAGHGRVIDVIDAQTLRLDDGKLVRLIGALPPEPPRWWHDDRPWPPLVEARSYLTELVKAKNIELRFAEAEKRMDRYDRLLAQVFVKTKNTFIWVQGDMIGHGYARAYSLKGHNSCIRPLQMLEVEARDGRHGLWKRQVFKTVKVEETELLLRRRGYQIVEGRVHNVARTRKWTFLNFSEDWKNDFTVAIEAANRRNFRNSDVETSSLTGKDVRIRGWIEYWNGPVIKASHAGQIEVIP